jgi:hypothetical protein
MLTVVIVNQVRMNEVEATDMLDRFNQSMRGVLEETLERMLCAVRGERAGKRVALTRIIIVRQEQPAAYAPVIARHRPSDVYWQR